MISSLIWLFVVVVVLGILWWGFEQIPLPQLVKVVLTVIFSIAALIIIARLLMGLVGGGLGGGAAPGL